MTNPGSGYAKAPKVVIRDGTLFAPVNHGAANAEAARYRKSGCGRGLAERNPSCNYGSRHRDD